MGLIHRRETPAQLLVVTPHLTQMQTLLLNGHISCFFFKLEFKNFKNLTEAGRTTEIKKIKQFYSR